MIAKNKKNKNNISKKQAFFLLIPILILAAWTMYHSISMYYGTKFVMEIEGFDPRDLLSGNYVRYQIKYPENMNKSCSKTKDWTYKEKRGAFVCINKIGAYKIKSKAKENCDEFLTGKCWNDSSCKNWQPGKGCLDREKKWKFESDSSNLERFYIPDKYGNKLDKAVRDKNLKREIVLSVKNGNAIVIDLLIDGKSWEEYVNK